MSLTKEQQEFKAKLRSVQFGSVPGGARDKAAAERTREKRWGRDLAGYASLREQGYQPPRVDGSGDLASVASSEWEINHGIALSHDLQKSHLPALKDAEAAIEPQPVAPWRPNT